MRKSETRQPETRGQGTSKARIQELGTRLRAALAEVLGEVCSPGVRPVNLTKILDIDDSLAARLLRAIRAGEPLSALREMPAPQGLRLFLEAAGKAGAKARTRAEAEGAVAALEQLLEEMPLGRASLETALDGWMPSGRARTERASKQAVFKAVSQTLGFTVETTCFTTMIQPSRSGDRCDAITLLAMDGIRRLREGAPILLLGHSKTSVAGTPEAPAMETLDGEREVTDARKLVIKEVGDGARLPVRLIERPMHARLVLESSEPPINVPVTAAIGYITRNAYLRYREESKRHEAFTNACKVPIRNLVQDVFLHEDVFPNFVPEVVPRMDNMASLSADRDEEVLEIDRLELEADMSRLGWGLDRAGIKEWSGYERAVGLAFEKAGWDSARFRGFRCCVRYPMPFVALTTWFELPMAGVRG